MPPLLAGRLGGQRQRRNRFGRRITATLLQIDDAQAAVRVDLHEAHLQCEAFKAQGHRAAESGGREEHDQSGHDRKRDVFEVSIGRPCDAADSGIPPPADSGRKSLKAT